MPPDAGLAAPFEIAAFFQLVDVLSFGWLFRRAAPIFAAHQRDAAGTTTPTATRPGAAAYTPDVVLPSTIRPVPEVAVVCDTSGSMPELLLAPADGSGGWAPPAWARAVVIDEF